MGSLSCALLVCTCWLLSLLPSSTPSHKRFISQIGRFLVTSGLAYGPLEGHPADHGRILGLEDKLLICLVLLYRQNSRILCPHDRLIILEHTCIVSSGADIDCHIIYVLRIICSLIFPITARIKN